jgi:hypothetical protein
MVDLISEGKVVAVRGAVVDVRFDGAQALPPVNSARLGKRKRPSRIFSVASQSSTEARVCSVISNWTGLPVFPWMIVARSRNLPPTHKSSIFKRTRSHSRNLLSIARLNIARSRLRASNLKADPDIPHFLGHEWALLAYEASLVPGACPWSRCWLSVLDMDVTSLSDHSLPSSQLSARQKHNAQVALKLRTADSSRSKWRLAVGSAPSPAIAGQNTIFRNRTR